MDNKILNRPEIDLSGVAEHLVPDHQIKFDPGEVGAILEWEVRRPDGTIREQGAKRAESFTRQFMDLLLVSMLGAPESQGLEIKDVAGNNQWIRHSIYTFRCNALANDDLFGMVVGTGSTAPTISDYAMETQIADGVGGGELEYGNQAYGLPTSNLTTSHFTLTRNFSNLSGADITVYEIGLYLMACIGSALYEEAISLDDYYKYFMTIRDVIGAGILVQAGETLTVNYRPLCVV